MRGAGPLSKNPRSPVEVDTEAKEEGVWGDLPNGIGGIPPDSGGKTLAARPDGDEGLRGDGPRCCLLPV